VDGKPSDPAAFFYSDPKPTRWEQINADPGFLYPTAEVIAAQSTMIDWYHTDDDDLVFLDHYIPFLESEGSAPDTLWSLKKIQTNLEQRMGEYKTLDVLTCFKPGFNTECLDKYNTMKTIRDTLYPIDQELLDQFNTVYYVRSIDELGFETVSYSVPVDMKNAGESLVYLNCSVSDGTCQPRANYYLVTFGDNTLNFLTYVNYNLENKADLTWYVGKRLSYYVGTQTDFSGKKLVDEQQWSPVPNPK